MKMTLDEMVKESKNFSDDELRMLAVAFTREYESRKNREQEECWKKVCDALDTYIRIYGGVLICNDGEEVELTTGYYAYNLGEISIE
jgi:hypothetical protein